MGRRIVALTFWLGILPSLGLLIVLGAEAFSSPPEVPNMLGNWDGFFEAEGDIGQPGLLSSTVDRQFQRRFLGNALLLSAEGQALFNAINFAGTLTREDFVTGTGFGLTGEVVFHGDLDTFSGATSDAGVSMPQFVFQPGSGGPNAISSILLHPFADLNAPNIAGPGVGSFQSEIDPTFRGDLAVSILRRTDRGTFPGVVGFMPDSGPHLPFAWNCLATTSADGRFVMIAQGQVGRLVADGVALPSPRSTAGASVRATSFTSVNALYKIYLNGGQLSDFGAYNFSLAP